LIGEMVEVSSADERRDDVGVDPRDRSSDQAARGSLIIAGPMMRLVIIVCLRYRLDLASVRAQARLVEAKVLAAFRFY